MARLAVLPLVLLLAGGSATEWFCQSLCAPSDRVPTASCHHAASDPDGSGLMTPSSGHGCSHSIAAATLASSRLDPVAAGTAPAVFVSRLALSRSALRAAPRGAPPGSSLTSVLRI